MPVTDDLRSLRGHCTCKAISYTLLNTPLIVHCCHCTYCQRETGSAFVLNMQIETSAVAQIATKEATEPTLVETPSASGTPQLIARCPKCWVALYSHYGGNMASAFVRVGTLDDESRHRVKPNVHIFTSTKAEWVDLKSEVERGAKVFDEFYEREKIWSKSALARREKMLKSMVVESDKDEEEEDE
ncbi:hypothetical protein K458DRAFT_381569 [Lentithecium fluviatile CBS 122367]|uniref:CENP-V/GFA domain-containing protein n=1 Tax=Lentithecium fluviatile CBS 122367 TaxID=1168545 RepID=A0A6G1JMC6_9PLEO|nr:hypothetical protein K458DRAFT_381569 [Lentithecium fluviatile CBS 122367]